MFYQNQCSMKTKIFTASLFLFLGAGLTAQPGTWMDFEDEFKTSEMILHMHTDDWQTDQAYTRDLYYPNPDMTGVNKTEYCAKFSGYSTDDNWWYGLDMVFTDSIYVTEDMEYLHVAMMTSTDQYDVNKGVLFHNVEDAESAQTWFPITTEWADYVITLPGEFATIKEMRFMLNHKGGDQTTFLDEIHIDNDSVPRTEITLATSSEEHIRQLTEPSFYVFNTAPNQIKILSKSGLSDIEVFSLTGSLIMRKQVSGNEADLSFHNKGLVIIRSNNESQKVMVY